MTKRDYEDLINYQAHRRFVDWILKFLIIIATGMVIVLGSYIGLRHAYNKAIDTTSTVLEMMDDEISDHVDNLMEDATSNPTDGVTNINTSIR